jgi:murein peptide amidase A
MSVASVAVVCTLIGGAFLNRACTTDTMSPVSAPRSMRHRAQRTITGAKPCVVAILGGTHGDEPQSVSLAAAVLSALQHESSVIAVGLPAVNPSGVAARTRWSATGVDINRNFPSRGWSQAATGKRYSPGPHPGSEPETQRVIEFVSRSQPDVIVSFHAPLRCINWDGPAEGAAATIAATTGYPLCRDLGYDTPGSLGQYFGIDRGLKVVTFESDRAVDIPTLAPLIVRGVSDYCHSKDEVSRLPISRPSSLHGSAAGSTVLRKQEDHQR